MADGRRDVTQGQKAAMHGPPYRPRATFQHLHGERRHLELYARSLRPRYRPTCIPTTGLRTPPHGVSKQLSYDTGGVSGPVSGTKKRAPLSPDFAYDSGSGSSDWPCCSRRPHERRCRGFFRFARRLAGHEPQEYPGGRQRARARSGGPAGRAAGGPVAQESVRAGAFVSGRPAGCGPVRGTSGVRRHSC